MSGDFEQWDNNPAQNEAPKPEKISQTSYDYWRERRREQVRVIIKILAAIAILIIGILWAQGWRPGWK